LRIAWNHLLDRLRHWLHYRPEQRYMRGRG
jgi:hypothetical protein